MDADEKSVTDNIVSSEEEEEEEEDEYEIFDEIKYACVDEVREQIQATGTMEGDIQTDEPLGNVRFKPGAANLQTVYEKLPNRLSAKRAAKLTPAAVFDVLFQAAQEYNFQIIRIDKDNILIREEVVDETSRKTN